MLAPSIPLLLRQFLADDFSSSRATAISQKLPGLVLRAAVGDAWSHRLRLYCSTLWGCGRQSNIDPSTDGKLFIEVQRQAITLFQGTTAATYT